MNQGRTQGDATVVKIVGRVHRLLGQMAKMLYLTQIIRIGTDKDKE